MRAALGTIAALTLLAATACSGGDDEPESSPDSPSSGTTTTTEQPADVCAVVTDEQAAAWAGAPRGVKEQSELSGALQCAVDTELGDPISIEWDLHPSAATFDRVLGTELQPGLATAKVDLDGTEITEATGKFAAWTYAQEFVPLDDGTLVVEVFAHRDHVEAGTPRRLRTIARELASSYLKAPGLSIDLPG
ncbi:hypothetical protein ABFU82_02205 [Nocardioides sp. WV_118_6]